MFRNIPDAEAEATVDAAWHQQGARYFDTAFARHAARFSGADFVEGFVHFRDDMETIENMQGLGTFLADDLQVGFPHV